MCLYSLECITDGNISFCILQLDRKPQQLSHLIAIPMIVCSYIVLKCSFQNFATSIYNEYYMITIRTFIYLFTFQNYYSVLISYLATFRYF